jgi:hypothetical protein
MLSHTHGNLGSNPLGAHIRSRCKLLHSGARPSLCTYGQNTTVLSGEVIEQVSRPNDETDGVILVAGSGTLGGHHNPS